MPAIELLVNNFAALEIAEVSREVVELISSLGVLVGDRNLEGREGIEDVELCVARLVILHSQCRVMVGHTSQIPGRVVVDRCRVFQHDQIEPSASPFPAGGDAPFTADLLQLLACLANVFGLEDALTNSCLFYG